MSQSVFATALLNPDAPPPPGLQRPDGAPAPRRFAVYRNNVAVGLTGVLEAAFPAIRKLVGDTFFTALAGEFLRAHPPQTRIMMLYGADFPRFVASFVPLAAYPYMADVARLEQSLRESYHAADTPAISPQDLATMSEATLLHSRVSLAPTVRLVTSVWPLHDIWTAAMENGPAPQAKPQDVLVLRPEFDPRPHLLPNGGGAFMAKLQSGATLIEAMDAAGPEFDLTALLTLLINGNAMTGLSQ